MSQVLPPAEPGRDRLTAPWRSVDLVSLDFEATGLDLRRDRIISFGTVPIRRGGIELADSVYQLVDPGDVQPSRESITVHGLRTADLVGAPSVQVARAALRRSIDRRFLVTWWAPVEAAFLDALFSGGRQAWMRRAIDVRDLVLGLEGRSAARLTLGQAAERFGVPVASPHNAFDDALVTAQLFLVTATKLGRRARSVRDMQELKPRSRLRRRG
ncbi:MAG TPA: 3'-5' exonuclease [Actinomycetota bacterium]|nr:3'-5' exonuclease [Actinomycetota bacterium]